MAALILAGGLLFRGLAAQPLAGEILTNISAQRAMDGDRITLTLICPFQYLDQMPAERGIELRIRVRPQPGCQAPRRRLQGRESIALPRIIRDRVRRIAYEGDPDKGPAIVIDFHRPTRFFVRTYSDHRELTIRLAPSDPPTHEDNQQ